MAENPHPTIQLAPDSDDPNIARSGDVLCFSSLPWDVPSGRARRLMTSCAKERRVFFFEEPTFGRAAPLLEVTRRDDVYVAVPRLPAAMAEDARTRLGVETDLLNELVARQPLRDFVMWLATPLALPMTLSLAAAAVVYDCGAEAPESPLADAEMPLLERLLFRHADLVLIGESALYEAKKHMHGNVHWLPSPESSGEGEWDRTWAAIEELLEAAVRRRCELGPLVPGLSGHPSGP